MMYYECFTTILSTVTLLLSGPLLLEIKELEHKHSDMTFYHGDLVSRLHLFPILSCNYESECKAIRLLHRTCSSLVFFYFTGYLVSYDCVARSIEILKGTLPSQDAGLRVLEGSFRAKETNLEVF